MTTIQSILGTPFEPNWNGAIFFWEEVGRAPRHIDQILTHFRQHGALERIAGMIVGRPLGCDDPKTDSEMHIRATVRSVCHGLDHIPILSNVDIGHTDPKLTFPIGVEADLRVDGNHTTLTIADSAVA